MSLVVGRLVVLVGPAGAGKTTLAHRLIDAAVGLRVFSVSHTTRQKREAEVDGVDYNFVSRVEFEHMIDAAAFVEWAEVHGNLYGTSHVAIASHLQAGRDVLFDVDIEGATHLYAAYPVQTRLVFITPPTWRALCERLERRGTETEATLRRRLRTARSELASVLAQIDAGVRWDLLCNDALAEATTAFELLLAAPTAVYDVAEERRLAELLADARADRRADAID
mgnify:CR=1 FL=1